jgi:rhodanese-related sulfurtransferase
MKPTSKHILIILFASGLAALVANSIHPRRVPWVQDWSYHVETRAAARQIKVVPLSVALGYAQSPGHVFIDARSEEEYREGHISDAFSIPVQFLEEKFSSIVDLVDSGKTLVVYCKNRDCDDALLVASELQAIGCSKLVLYVDGFELWEKHGGPVEVFE